MENFLDIFSLSKKTAVITGGAGILGRDMAFTLGRAGAKVAICDIADTGDLIDDLKEKGIDAKGYYIDVLKKDEIVKCHDKVLSDLKKIDILISAAGGNLKTATTSEETPFFSLPLEGLEKVIALNLYGGAILPA